MTRMLFFLAILCSLTACPEQRIASHSYDPLPNLVSNLDYLYHMEQDSLNLQILFSPISRDSLGTPRIDTTYRYGTSFDRYFYPASTVKMPVAALALQRLHELDVDGLDAHSVLKHGAGRPPQTAAEQDTSDSRGLPSVGHYLRKIFLVSDNDAYNRLFEWLGPDYINNQMRRIGLNNSRILHRLAVSGYDTLGNRWMNPIRFETDQGHPLLELGERYSAFHDDLDLKEQQLGRGYYDDDLDTVVYEPFDFSHKNYYSLEDMHGTVGRLVVPDAYPEDQRFGLDLDDYTLIWTVMAQRPRESPSPHYTEADNYVKFWLFGDRDSTVTIPPNIRILNKVGWAYGYLSDAAYIVDLDAGIEFLLSATIHTNANRIYNDGQYEYQEVGLPFFGGLGRALYDHLLEERRQSPLPTDAPLIRTLQGLR